MPELGSKTLKGRRVLIAEDEYLVAMDLALSLENLGIEIVGPAGTLEGALELVKRTDRLDGAVLDVNLRGQRVFPVAETLAQRNIPFIFTTGYDAAVIPEPYAGAPRCEKPVNNSQVIGWSKSVWAE